MGQQNVQAEEVYWPHSLSLFFLGGDSTLSKFIETQKKKQDQLNIQNGTIVGCGCDNKVNDDDSGKLQPQNAH